MRWPGRALLIVCVAASAVAGAGPRAGAVGAPDVAAFGGARYLGSTAGRRLRRPIVGIAALPNGRGYWLASADGEVFAFGAARSYGSTGPLNRPIVDIAATRSGHGYWLVASDGGIFSFGDARFHGSTGGTHLNQPIVGMAPTRTGHGYWLVASDGGIFSFGDAPFDGSSDGGFHDAVGIAANPAGHGYWIATAGSVVPPSVFVVGDSLTVGSEPYFGAAFGADGIAYAGADAEVGRHTSQGVDALAEDIAAGRIGPQTTIVAALGTNDYGDGAAFGQEVDRFLAVAAGRPVVWVNLAFGDARDADALALDAQLDARGGELQVADWHDYIAAHPEWWAGDGVHLTAAGYEARALWLASRLAA